MIKCTRCKQTKSESEFYKNGYRKKNGLSSECKKCAIEYSKKYYGKHSERIKNYSRSWYKNNSTRQLQLRVVYRQKLLSEWEGIIPLKTQCQMCGKDIYFNGLDKDTAINFDHRNGGDEPINKCPTKWLKENKRTPANEKIWKECNFGMLCSRCNFALPTKDRLLFLENATRYIKGEQK